MDDWLDYILPSATHNNLVFNLLDLPWCPVLINFCFMMQPMRHHYLVSLQMPEITFSWPPGYSLLSRSLVHHWYEAWFIPVLREQSESMRCAHQACRMPPVAVTRAEGQPSQFMRSAEVIRMAALLYSLDLLTPQPFHKNTTACGKERLRFTQFMSQSTQGQSSQLYNLPVFT